MKSLLLSHGIDVELATVELTGEVDYTMYRKVFRAVHLLKDKDYITFVINTHGGFLSDGFAIYDLIKSAAPNCKMVGVGSVASAGSVIFAASDDRVCYPGTEFLIHYGEDSSASGGEAHHNKKRLQHMKDIIERSVNVKRRTINGWFHKETYFDAKRALEVGLVQRIIG